MKKILIVIALFSVIAAMLFGVLDHYPDLKLFAVAQANDGKRSQLMIERGLFSYDGTPTYHTARKGHSAVVLRDGRVLLLGGYNTPLLASLLEPNLEKGAWVDKPVANMPNERTLAAAMLLSDDRVVITGGSPRCYDEAAKTRSVDVYDVQANRWSSLPALPFVPCANAYGATSPSITATPNGSLVVGGYLEPQVMVLPRNTTSPTGYANSWNVYGDMSLPRIGGVVEALSDHEVIVTGGWSSIENKLPSCCYANPGHDRINITPSETKQSLAMSFIGAGVAKRGQKVFAASGRRFGFISTGQMRYSALAELLDLSTGSARQLPNVPFASGAAQAIWLDDDRVLLKGIKEAGDRGFALNENLSSAIPPSSGDMAIFNIEENRWGVPFAMPELNGAQIVSAEGSNVLLLDDGGAVHKFNLVSRILIKVQQAQRGRHGGMARLLPQGKLVMAGGEVQGDTVSVLDADCEATSVNECAEKFVGFGPYSATALVEELSLKDNLSLEDNMASTDSKLSPSGINYVASTVIASDGQVISLSASPDNKVVAITRRKLNGASWDDLPLPQEIEVNRYGDYGFCALQIAPDPRNPSQNLLFLRQGSIAVDGIDDQISDQNTHVWWWNEAEQTWQHVLRSRGMSARSSPLALEEPLSPQQGKRMMSMGWHLREPVLWIEP
jgi:hypothetical protein